MNYNPSTIARIADINLGLRVDKGPVLAVDHLAIQVYPLFRIVGGRVVVLNFIAEVTEAFAADATILQLYYTGTGAVRIDLTAKALTAASLALGRRLVAAQTIGGALTFSAANSVAVISTLQSYILGRYGVGGVMGIESSVAAMTDGAMIYSLWYLPLDDGAYVEAA
jgi:hypothetical protein